MTVYLVEAGGITPDQLKRFLIADKVRAMWVCPTVEAVRMVQPAFESTEVPHFNLCCPLAPHQSENKPLTQTQTKQWKHDHHIYREIGFYPPSDESTDDARCRVEDFLSGIMSSVLKAPEAGHCLVMDGSTLMSVEGLYNIGDTKLQVFPTRTRGVVAKYEVHAMNRGLVLTHQIQ